MRTGSPENTRRQRPTPFGPQPSSTHCCSLIGTVRHQTGAAGQGDVEQVPLHAAANRGYRGQMSRPDTAQRSLDHWSEAGRAGMEAFYSLATEDYLQLAAGRDWAADLFPARRC